MASEYRGVYLYQRSKRPGWSRWMVKFHVRGHFSGRETWTIGYFKDEVHAARVADVAEEAIREDLVGEPNFPDEPITGVERLAILDQLRQLKQETAQMYADKIKPSRKAEMITWIYDSIEHELMQNTEVSK